MESRPLSCLKRLARFLRWDPEQINELQLRRVPLKAYATHPPAFRFESLEDYSLLPEREQPAALENAVEDADRLPGSVWFEWVLRPRSDAAGDRSAAAGAPSRPPLDDERNVSALLERLTASVFDCAGSLIDGATHDMSLSELAAMARSFPTHTAVAAAAEAVAEGGMASAGAAAAARRIRSPAMLELCCRYGPAALRGSSGCRTVVRSTVEAELERSWDTFAAKLPARQANAIREETAKLAKREAARSRARTREHQAILNQRRHRGHGSSAGRAGGQWEEAIDPATGKTYWFQRSTGLSTWEQPQDNGGGRAEEGELDDDDMTRLRRAGLG